MIKKIIAKFKRYYYSTKVKAKAAHTGNILKANFPTHVTSNTYIGNNFNSNGLMILGRGKVEIGQNFHCGFGCIIMTENHNYNGKRIPYDETYIIKNTVIEDNVWLGINVTILPGCCIGEGAIIQAGSVVAKSIPPLSIAGGHPATVFSKRDPTHYFSLKDMELFH